MIRIIYPGKSTCTLEICIFAVGLQSCLVCAIHETSHTVFFSKIHVRERIVINVSVDTGMAGSYGAEVCASLWR